MIKKLMLSLSILSAGTLSLPVAAGPEQATATVGQVVDFLFYVKELEWRKPLAVTVISLGSSVVGFSLMKNGCTERNSDGSPKPTNWKKVAVGASIVGAASTLLLKAR